MTQNPVLGGRYQLDQVIGRGGMAEVWRARDQRLGRDVAVKRLRVDLATDPTFQARFRREAQAAAGLNHPNIVATYDTGEEVDDKTQIAVPYIVMELVEGHTLRDLLRADRRILPQKAFEWTQQVLDALNYSHRAGIVHRDIKPANVMLTPSGQVKVMDFGIARAVADTSATMTQTAAVIGTAQYLSPEQARGETVDSRSDIYSAGCLLYELLVGRPPFIGDSPVSVAYQHVREQPVTPSHLDPELTTAMDAVVLKSLAKNPADRYQSARDMRDDIGRLLAGEPVLAAAPALPTEQLAPTALTQAIEGPQAQGTAAQAVVPATGTTAAVEDTGVHAAPEPTRRRGLGWLIALLLLALLAVVGVSAYRFFSPTDTSSQVQVPGVVGNSETSAKSSLEGQGLKVATKHVNGAASTEDTVTAEDPSAGTSVAKGSTVTITVNDGPVTNKVPSGLIGMTKDEAVSALTAAGFKKANISTKDASSDQESQHLDFSKGQVVVANPAPGADVVPATQKVVLYLATGKSSVPNLIGYTEQEAKDKLSAAGFSNVDVTTETVSEEDQDGKVVSQSPSADKSTTRTDAVTIVIGSYVAAAAPTSSTATTDPSTTQSSSSEPSDTATENPSATSSATATSTATATSSATGGATSTATSSAS